MNTEKLVVGLAGMPGAGKSLVVETAMEMGYAVVVMGDVIREETRRRGLKLSPENVGNVMLELRRVEGGSVVARRCIPRIEQTGNARVLVDGVRSLDEVEEFKKHFLKFKLVAVHASPETRFGRLHRRRRSDDPSGWEVFRERDMRELSVGLGGAVAMAEYMIVNENGREAAKSRVRQVLRMVEEEWMK